MVTARQAPYGSWESPITSDLIVSGTIGLSHPVLDGGDTYWIESRPSEGGRNVIVRRTQDGTTSDVNPAPFNARTRVHEYGGGAYWVSRGVVYFCNFTDQRIYRQDPGGPASPITLDIDMRYAEGVVDAARDRTICIREDHTGGRDPENTLAAIPVDGADAGTVLVSGSDFYASPRISPDGSRLAWLEWDRPNMPWDGTELWEAGINPDGSLDQAVLVAGGLEESIFQPEWSPNGTLHFASDRTGWFNIYRWRDQVVEAVCPMDAEFGNPRFNLGNATYGFESEDRIISSYSRDGVWGLASIDTGSGELEDLGSPYTEMGRGGDLRVESGAVVFTGGSASEPMSIVRLDLATGRMEVLRTASSIAVDAGYLSPAQPVDFPTENGLVAHAFYYPPVNRDFVAPAGEKPPLLVKSHGGPTGATSTALDLQIQYWTSRGIAVIDVNYGGSTGYGRAYRERLNGQWGIVDVDDCVNAARYLVEQGLADGDRLAIDGGSAGGFTTLAALTFRDVFKAGASYYGVSDLEGLATDTHKFESRYLDKLVGPYPERKDLYQERSPIHHTEGLSCPLIFFQGLEDRIVPPSQAERMYQAVLAKGLPTAYLPFEGEQHGFRRAENIKRALDGELYFFARVFGFEPAGPLEPVDIENL